VVIVAVGAEVLVGGTLGAGIGSSKSVNASVGITAGASIWSGSKELEKLPRIRKYAGTMINIAPPIIQKIEDGRRLD
jgi:hypothetical protein